MNCPENPLWAQVTREEEDEAEAHSPGIDLEAPRRRVELGSQSLHVYPGIGKRSQGCPSAEALAVIICL